MPAVESYSGNASVSDLTHSRSASTMLISRVKGVVGNQGQAYQTQHSASASWLDMHTMDVQVM